MGTYYENITSTLLRAQERVIVSLTEIGVIDSMTVFRRSHVFSPDTSEIWQQWACQIHTAINQLLLACNIGAKIDNTITLQTRKHFDLMHTECIEASKNVSLALKTMINASGDMHRALATQKPQSEHYDSLQQAITTIAHACEKIKWGPATAFEDRLERVNLGYNMTTGEIVAMLPQVNLAIQAIKDQRADEPVSMTTDDSPMPPVGQSVKRPHDSNAYTIWYPQNPAHESTNHDITPMQQQPFTGF